MEEGGPSHTVVCSVDFHIKPYFQCGDFSLAALGCPWLAVYLAKSSGLLSQEGSGALGTELGGKLGVQHF